MHIALGKVLPTNDGTTFHNDGRARRSGLPETSTYVRKRQAKRVDHTVEDGLILLLQRRCDQALNLRTHARTHEHVSGTMTSRVRLLAAMARQYNSASAVALDFVGCELAPLRNCGTAAQPSAHLVGEVK